MRVFLAVIAVIILITAVAACSVKEDIDTLVNVFDSISAQSEAPQSDEAEIEVNFREPQTAQEEFAVSFVTAHANIDNTEMVEVDIRGSSYARYKEGLFELLEYANPDEFAYWVVSGVEPVHLAQLVERQSLLVLADSTSNASGTLRDGTVLGVTDMAELPMQNITQTWLDPIPLGEVLTENTIAVVYNERGSIKHVLVNVTPYNDSFSVVPWNFSFNLPIDATVFGESVVDEGDFDFRITVPDMSNVTLGSEDVPVGKSVELTDMGSAVISGMPGSEIRIDVGSYIPPIIGEIVYNPIFAPGSTNTLSNNIMELAVTRTEYRELESEIIERSVFLSDKVAELLDTDNKEGFLEITHNDERFEGGEFLNPNGVLHADYEGRFKLWQRNAGGMSGATRKYDIYSIEIIRPDTVRVSLDTHIKLVSGNEFLGRKMQLVLEHVEEEWMITNISRNFFSYSPDFWEKIEG